MKGKERIMTALGRGTPDTVPVWELAFNEASVIGLAKHFMDEGKLPPNKFFFDMDEMELFQLIDAFRAMSLGLELDGVNAVISAPMERLDEEHIRDEHGIVYHVSDYGEPYPVQGPIGSLDDLKSYKMRSPKEEDFILGTLMRAQFPDMAVSFMFDGPFVMSWGMRGGMEKLMLDYMIAPELVHGLIRMTTDYYLESLDILSKKGIDFIVIADDLAHQYSTLMSPAQFNEFVGPYYKELIDKTRELGLKAVKHSDGVLTPLVPYFIEEGFDGLHPIQPQCMDIGETKRTFGDRLCILGNIDCAFLLVDGTPEEVRETVKKTIEAAAPGGGYIISSSNTIHPGCKPENYIALVEAAREFGSYE